MAVRRLNYTGRKRITRDDAVITIFDLENGAASFDAVLNLDRYRLASDSCVFVEAYRQTTWMRFDFGTVGHLVPPKQRRLTDFDTVEALLFRVRVTAVSGRHGVILAEADRIRPQREDEREENRIPLLPVKPDDALAHEIVRLEFNDQDRPLLLINSALGNWRALAREPAFISLVYPTAFREILTRILLIEKHSDTDDNDDWRSQWLRYASILPGVEPLPDEMLGDQVVDWIDETVSTFARQHRILHRFRAFWSEGEAE